MKGKTFLAKDVGMVTKRASLDYDKIVLWGHGLGGITAISAGIRDKRISAMISLDPWMFPCQDDVPQMIKGLTGKQKPIQIISTEKFNSYESDTKTRSDKSQLETLEEFVEGAKDKTKIEHVIEKGLGHFN